MLRMCRRWPLRRRRRHAHHSSENRIRRAVEGSKEPERPSPRRLAAAPTGKHSDSCDRRADWLGLAVSFAAPWRSLSYLQRWTPNG
jgi:hypothetical protein